MIILSVAFAPGLVKRQQQAEIDQVVNMITNAVQELRSLAISPTRVDPDTGKVMQAWIMILNMHPTDYQDYCYPVEDGDRTACGVAVGTGKPSQRIPPHSYIILAARDTSPSITRYKIKTVSLPDIQHSNIRLFYNFPCHYNGNFNCPPVSIPDTESFLWKLHFRHLDGAIGYAGRYYNYPDVSYGYAIGYWQEGIWGLGCSSPANCPQTTDLVVVGGSLINDPGPESNVSLCSSGIYNGKPCKIIHVDNVTGAVNVSI